MIWLNDVLVCVCRYRLQCKDIGCGQQPGGAAVVGYSRTGEVKTCTHQNMFYMLYTATQQKINVCRKHFFYFPPPPFCFCRYRSITKQFFRKADGVVVIYDITDVQSFTAVRQWLTSVKARPRVLCRNATSRTNLLVELVFLCSIFSSAGWTEWSPSGCVFCNVVRKHRLSGFLLRSLQGS